MVSTILCPRCKTKNSKKDEICYKCKYPLKTRKNSSILSFDPKSKIELKIIAIGVTVFVLTNVILLDIAYDYSYMISGFSTMLYLYFVFKKSPIAPSDNTVRGVGFKIILNYAIIAVLGIIALFVIGSV